MSPHRSGGIAARAGRWSAQHRKTAIFGWLAFVRGGPIGQEPLAEGDMSQRS